MNCDGCGTRIGNTLYEIGTPGQKNYRRLCPVCWLGPEKGNEPKYQRFDAAWTEAKLKKHKDDTEKQRLKNLE